MVLAFLLALLGVIFALLGVTVVARGIKGSRMSMLPDTATWRRKCLWGSASSLILGGTVLVLVGILRMVSLSPSAMAGVWIRCAIILALATLAWHMLRTSFMTCTLIGVGLASLAVSFCESEQLVAMVLVAGPTLGALAGTVVETLKTRERRMQSVIERRYARTYTCPQCGHVFMSLQLVGQCTQCECRFAQPSERFEGRDYHPCR